MIVNDVSRVVNKLETSLTDDAIVIIYDRRMFIVQATGGQSSNPYLNVDFLSPELIRNLWQCGKKYVCPIKTTLDRSISFISDISIVSYNI
jgi:hypothetical protein